jgi:hypothetical protein
MQGAETTADSNKALALRVDHKPVLIAFIFLLAGD